MSEYYLTKDELYHHGVKGQKWGLRQWQNEDGSLTEAGRKHYGYGDSRYDTKQNFKNAKSELQKARLNELSAFKRASSGSFNSINDRKLDESLDRTKSAKEVYKQAKKDYKADKITKRAEQKAWKQQRRDYIATKTTGERIATGLLLGPAGLYNYNSLMAVGASNGNKLANFGKAAATTYLTGGLGNMTYSTIIANREKQKY